MPKPVKYVMWRVQFLNKGKPDNTSRGFTYVKTRSQEEAHKMIKHLHPGRAYRLQTVEEYDQESRDAFANKIQAYYREQEAQANGRPAAKKVQARKVRSVSRAKNVR